MHTPEQRDQHPLCGAKKRSDGTPCRLFAGQGTDHAGVGRCRLHGGNTPSHEKAAMVEQAKQKLAKLGTPYAVTPGQLMAGNVHLSAGHLMLLTEMVSELDDLETPEARAVLRLWTDERKLSAQVAKLAADMGVTERMTQLAEQQTLMVARLIESVAEDIALTDEQKHLLGPAIRRRMAQATGQLVEATAA
jgi:hypothetical protein